MFDKNQTTLLRDAILAAGDAIMEIYNRDDVNVSEKKDASPVTEADLAADQIIRDVLASAFPNEAVVTEEQAQSHSISADRFFIVDPLDGTKEFIHKRGDFTVNIGFVENGTPVFGMVYAPAKDRLFFTEGDQAFEEIGPFKKGVIGETRPIHVASSDNSALRIVASKSHRDAATDEYIAQYQVSEFTSAGSSLKFCLVATGEADLYPRLGPTMEWDTAAADAVVRAAGGQVLDFESLEPFAYGKPEFRNGFFIVTSGSVDLKA